MTYKLEGENLWWNEENDDDAASMMVAAARALREDQKSKEALDIRHARLYCNTNAISFSPKDFIQPLSAPIISVGGALTGPSFNVVNSCIDTLSAKLTKSTPRPFPVTSGGNYEQQKRAKKLDKALQGLFYICKVPQSMNRSYVDAEILGTGAIKIYMHGKTRKLCVERTLPGELFIDDVDGMYGSPTQLFQRKFVSKSVLAGWIEKKEGSYESSGLKEAIESAKVDSEYASTANIGDRVEVWEAWKLPSYDKAGDGKHIIAIDGADILVEEWKSNDFPFAFVHYSDRPIGFWGLGVAERLVGIQLEINRLLNSISEQLRRRGKGRGFYQKGSINPKDITNGIASLVPYNGSQPPIFDNGNAVAAEEFAQLDRLVARAFDEIGVSQMSAAGRKDPGINSGVAIRERDDIESERFVKQGQRFEQFAIDIADRIIDCFEMNNVKSYNIRYLDGRKMDEVNWKDCAMDRKNFVFQTFPVSALPGTPAARLEQVMEFLQQGIISDMAEARRLLNFPDLESENDLATAALDDVDATISKILDDDEPQFSTPEDYQNLQLLLSRGTAAYLRAKNRDTPEDRLDMMRQMLDSVATKLKPPPAPPAPPMAAPTDPSMGAAAGGMPSDALGMPPPIPGAPQVPPDVQAELAGKSMPV